MTLEMGGDDQRFLRAKHRPAAPTRGCLRVVDLFSGCGGLTLGIEEAARQLRQHIDVRLAAEVDRGAVGIYTKNFGGGHHIGGDVRSWFDRAPGRARSAAERATKELVGSAPDILVGGPPCQGHSTLNNHTRGDDPKNELYLVMVRAAEVVEPRALLIENVPAIERDQSDVVQRAVRSLERQGYFVDHGIVSVADIGVPQLRRRHILLAHRSARPSIEVAVAAARVTRLRPVSWAIRDVCVGITPYDSPGVLTIENQKRAAFLLRHDLYDLPNRLRPECQRGSHKYKSMYGRLSWGDPAQTITTGFGSPGQGRYLHPAEPRTLTPHEAARIQFFPDWFDFSPLISRRHLARAIGNAVPSKLSFVLSHHLFTLNRRARKSEGTVLAHALDPLTKRVGPART